MTPSENLNLADGAASAKKVGVHLARPVFAFTRCLYTLSDMAYTLYYHANSRGFAEKVRMLLAETGIVRLWLQESSGSAKKWKRTPGVWLRELMKEKAVALRRNSNGQTGRLCCESGHIHKHTESERHATTALGLPVLKSGVPAAKPMGAMLLRHCDMRTFFLVLFLRFEAAS